MARHTGWTVDTMRSLTPSELNAIVQELERQVAIDQYVEQKNHWSFLAAVMANGFSSIGGMFSKRKPKMVEPDDFMGKDAKKMMKRLLGQEKDWTEHMEEAKAKGLKSIPEGGEKDAGR